MDIDIEIIGEDDPEEEESGRVTIFVEWDDLLCEPCADLNETIWDENIWGPCPIPVHPNCRCWVEEAAPNPFNEAAEEVANAGFNSLSGALLSFVLVGVLTVAGKMMDDFLGGGGLSPDAWLAKWGDRYPV